MGKKGKKAPPSVTEAAKTQVLKGAADDFGERLRGWTNPQLGFAIIAAVLIEGFLGPTLFKFLPGVDVVLFSIFAMPVGAELMRRGGKEVFLRGVRDTYLQWLAKRHLAWRITMLLGVVGVEAALTFFHVDFIPWVDTWLLAVFGLPVLDSVITEFWPKGQIEERDEAPAELEEPVETPKDVADRIWPTLAERLDQVKAAVTPDESAVVAVPEITLAQPGFLQSAEREVLSYLSQMILKTGDWSMAEGVCEPGAVYPSIVLFPSRALEEAIASRNSDVVE